MRTLKFLFALAVVGLTYVSFWFSSYCFSQREELMKYVGKINDFLGKYEVPFYLPEDAWKIAYYTNQVAWVLLTFIVVSLWWNRRKVNRKSKQDKTYMEVLRDNETLFARLDQAETESREAKRKLTDATARNAEIEAELGTSVDAVMIASFRDTTDKLKKVEFELEKARVEIDRLRSEAAQAETKSTLLRQNEANLQQQVKELSSANARIQKSLDDTVQERNQIALQNAKFNASPSNLDLAGLRKDLDKTLVQINNGLNTSTASIQQAATNLGSAAEVATLRQELADAKVQVARLNSGLGPDISREIDRIIGILDSISGNYNEAAKLINAGSYNAAIKQLNAFAPQLNKMIEALRALRNKNVNPGLEDAKTAARKEGELSAKNESLQQQLSDERSRSDKLMSMVDSLTQRLDSLTRLEDSASQIGEATEEIQSLQKAIESLRKELEEANRLLAQVEEDQRVKLDEQQKDLGTKLDRLDSRMAMLAQRNGHAHRGSRGSGRRSEEVDQG